MTAMIFYDLKHSDTFDDYKIAWLKGIGWLCVPDAVRQVVDWGPQEGTNIIGENQ